MPHEQASEPVRTGAAEPAPPEFFTIDERHTGGAIYSQVVIFLGEAALAGLVGASAYDGIKLTVRTIAERWRARQRAEPLEPTRAEMEDLARAAIRLRFGFGVDIRLVTEELTRHDALQWSGKIRNVGTGEIYRVRLGPDQDVTAVTVLISPA